MFFFLSKQFHGSIAFQKALSWVATYMYRYRFWNRNLKNVCTKMFLKCECKQRIVLFWKLQHANSVQTDFITHIIQYTCTVYMYIHIQMFSLIYKSTSLEKEQLIA